MKDIMSIPPAEVFVLDPEGIDKYVRPISGSVDGTQAQVGSIDAPGIPDGVVLKRMGINKSLTRTEASLLQSRLAPYRKSLIDSGWNVPELYGSHLAVVDTEWQIWTYEERVDGSNMASLAKNPNSQALVRYGMGRMITTLATYDPVDLHRVRLQGRELTLLPHGIDLQPANIIVSHKGEVCAIDIFGPKETDRQGNFMTYSSKLESAPPRALKVACATREGAILRLLRKTQKLWVDGGQDADGFMEEIDELLALSGLPAQEAEYIASDMDAGYKLLDRAYQFAEE